MIIRVIVSQNQRVTVTYAMKQYQSKKKPDIPSKSQTIEVDCGPKHPKSFQNKKEI